MNKYYFAVVAQSDPNTLSEGDGLPIAEVVFTARSLADDTNFVFDALRDRGISQLGSSVQLTNQKQLGVFPNTLREDRPDWEEGENRLWIFRRLPTPTRS